MDWTVLLSWWSVLSGSSIRFEIKGGDDLNVQPWVQTTTLAYDKVQLPTELSRLTELSHLINSRFSQVSLRLHTNVKSKVLHWCWFCSGNTLFNSVLFHIQLFFHITDTIKRCQLNTFDFAYVYALPRLFTCITVCKQPYKQPYQQGWYGLKATKKAS